MVGQVTVMEEAPLCKTWEVALFGVLFVAIIGGYFFK